jgi:hypothetical protein
VGTAKPQSGGRMRQNAAIFQSRSEAGIIRSHRT